MKGPVAVAATLMTIGHVAHALTLTEGVTWSSFPIPVCFEEPRPMHRQDRTQIRKSVEQSWDKHSAVSFSGWGACRTDSKGIRIRLSKSYPTTKARGRAIDGIVDGMHLPVLWGLTSLALNANTTVHEFGHALGFGHEHARPDAPSEEDCSARNADNQRYIEDDLPITTFDFDSIMVGCVKGATDAFSTGVPKLSAADIYGLVSTYGSAPDNILDIDETGDRFGHSIAIGDFDGDEVPDLAVGAPGKALGAPASTSGAVYLFKGDEILGLRPWGRLIAAGHPGATGKDLVGFGTTLQVDFLNTDERADLIVSTSDGTSFSFKGRIGKPLIFLDLDTIAAKPVNAYGEPESVPSPNDDIHTDIINAVQSVAPFDIDASPGKIEFGTASALVDLDLDLIVTAPQAAKDGTASGQVFIYRSPNTDFPWKQRPSTFTPWYRFGQAY